MKKVRVLIVEDSVVVRQFLEHIIARDPRLEIAGAVGTAEEALRILERVSPDVISMDIRLPGMNGFEATEQIMREKPTPVVVVSASVEREDLQITMNALRAGALTVLEKPTGVTSDDYEALAERICTQLVIMSQVKLVRRRVVVRQAPRLDRGITTRLAGYRALAVVSSTGGPNALVQLLSGLGPGFPLPILAVQHIASSFLEGFASWLDGVSPFSVEIVRDRTPTIPGKVYLASPDHHLQTEIGTVCVDTTPPVSGQRPSGTVLFNSMAGAFGSQGLGVLLTGMGDDGAEGLLRLRQRGGYTIAEDESTAVVYGMPAEAVRLGGVSESLPLPAIASRILELVLPRREVA
jgi:two-component system chemotaxis response regulator CheB